MRRALSAGFLVIATLGVLRAQSPAAFRWAGDPEGGAPYVEASPTDPATMIGFDVEVAALIARGLGRAPTFVFVRFESIRLLAGAHQPFIRTHPGCE